MNCEEALTLISGRLDGENTTEEEQALEDHLAQCAACRELLESLRNMDEDMKDLETPPASLRRSVMEQISAEAKPKSGKGNARRWLYLVAAAALCLAVGLDALNGGRVEFMSFPSPAAMAEYAAAQPAAQAGPQSRAMAEEAQPDGAFQTLAEERQAAVVVTGEPLAELEGLEGETLDDGSVLYALADAQAAAALSETCGLELYTAEDPAAGYVLLLP